MKPGPGVAYAFYSSDCCAIQRADGSQTGIDCMVPSEYKREAQITNYVTSVGKRTEHPLGASGDGLGAMAQALHLCLFSSAPIHFTDTASENQSDLFRVTAGVPVAELKLDLIIPISEQLQPT